MGPIPDIEIERCSMSVLTGKIAEDFVTASESTLIAHALWGNNDAFTQLVNRNRDRLYSHMLRITRSHDLAEEIVQYAFVQAFLKLHTFRQQAAFSTWLFQIAYFQSISLNRKKVVTTSLNVLTENSHWQPIDPGGSAETMCLRSEERQKVTDALARLDAKSRDILVLRELQGLTYEEIGTQLELRPGTVRSQLSRARAKLLQELSPPAETEDSF